MEKGLPVKGDVTVPDSSRSVGAVYELSRGGAVEFSRRDDGRLFAFLREPIARVALDAAVEGGALKIKFRLFGESDVPVEGRLPVEIRVRDAKGREIDGAGWACAADGVCVLSVPLNLDDPQGGYTITARDIASGLTAAISTNPL